VAPSYIAAGRSGALEAAAASLEERFSPCRLCPHRCGVRRRDGESGKCNLGAEILVASAGPHFGEESPLVGAGGSGAIFFSSCNLACVFCQNYEISHFRRGEEVTPRELSQVMLRLQRMGCHNINLVTPTHVIAGVVRALVHGASSGLSIPLVYNCGGYESVETLRLLEGIVDIYMPDIKYSSSGEALQYSGVPEYWERVQEAILEMHRQVGDLKLDSRGIAERGLLIRHLVMPGGLAGTNRVLDFIASRVSGSSYVNVMDQYRPCFKAQRIPELSRPITRSEYLEAAAHARRLGLTRGLPR
jgi:putative pyruvate formate lyase activating enzyme